MAGLDAEVVGTPTYDTTTQKFGTTAYIGNSTSYFRSPSITMPALPFTVEGWVKRSATNSTRVACGKVNSFWIGTSSGQVAVAKYGTSTGEVSLTHTATISDGAWHHVAFVLTSTGGTLYVDGVSVAGSTSTTTPTAAGFYFEPGNTNYETTFGIGNFGNAANFPWQDGSLDDWAVWNIAKYTANFTAPTTAVDPAAANLVALYNFEGTPNTNSATTRATIPFSNSSISYSPYNWDTSGSAAITINPGAYFRCTFQGSSCVLNVDTTVFNGATSTPLPQILYRVDNHGTWNTVVLTSTSTTQAIPIDIPIETLRFYTQHNLEVVIKSTTETRTRWTASSLQTAFKLTSLSLDTGRGLSSPQQNQSIRTIIYSDSLGEGVRTVTSSGLTPSDTDRNDVHQTWSYVLGRALGEVGMVCFGGTGYVQTGSGSVPNLQNSYNLIYQGVSRSFSTNPDLIVICLGQNDSTANSTAQTTFINAVTTCINNLQAASPNSKFMIFCFNSVKGPFIQQGIAACVNPQKVTFVDTTGYVVPNETVDGIHPYGFSSMKIGSRLIPIARAILNPSPVQRKPTSFGFRL
jgi:hypothetical protein